MTRLHTTYPIFLIPQKSPVLSSHFPGLLHCLPLREGFCLPIGFKEAGFARILNVLSRFYANFTVIGKNVIKNALLRPVARDRIHYEYAQIAPGLSF